MTGWIKLHRSLMDHWICGEPEALLFWLSLLMDANHTTVKKLFNGSLIEIKRGQLLFGLESAEKKTGISIRKMRRYLLLMEKEGMIDRQKRNKYSLITIANYEKHQGDGRQAASERQADDKQAATLNNVNNGENGNKTKLPAPADKPSVDFSVFGLSDDDLAEVKRIRVKNKGGAITTQRVANGLSKEISLALSNGLTIDSILTEWETRGWKSFKAEWLSNSFAKANPMALPPAQNFQSGDF